MMSTTRSPYEDAPRRTRGVQQINSTYASPAEASIPYERRAERVYTLPAPVQPNPKTSAIKTPSLMGTRTRIPAPAKITMPDVLIKAEMSRSYTDKSSKTPISGTSRQTLKDKFIKGVLSTQLGQAVSDNLAPHIPRSVVAGFPEDDEFHSRNSYIDATIALWDQMRARSNASSDWFESTIQPDEMPTWTLNDVDAPCLPVKHEEDQAKPNTVKAPQPHPTILRPGLKAPVRRSGYLLPDPPKDEVDDRIPIYQPLKAQAYHGKHDPLDPLQAQTHRAKQEKQNPREMISAKDKVDYRVPIQQAIKAETYHGKQGRQATASIQHSLYQDLPAQSDRDPDDKWQTSSFGDIKYWVGQDLRRSGLLLKAAPVMDLTDVAGDCADKDTSSRSSNKGHRQQQIYGSYSKDDANKLKSGSYTSSRKPQQAQTYPATAPRATPTAALASVNPHSHRKAEDGSAVAIPKSATLIKRKPVPSATSTIIPVIGRPAVPLRLPRPKPINLPSQQPEPAPDYLMGIKPPAEKRPRAKPTAEQRQLAAGMLNKPSMQSLYTRTARPPISPNFPDRKPPVAQKPLNPQAKTYIRHEKPIEHSQFVIETVPAVSTQTPMSDGYLPSQGHGNHNEHGPGLNPTAKTFYKGRYYYMH